ncbi:uncharacterized protein LOC133202394 [Saccostrea echinata]|uniref:uncharacterized protein LOC133202394 n=1 Tax=Saccostrea echinata TaxID=191078 RepID=UPI002A82F4E0|nr:uncharacterized protein LOC133202394 [Saccostrea echinata]
MVKTIPLFIGAGTLTLAIIVLYNVSQPDNHIIKFFRRNRTNDEKNSVSLNIPVKISAQEFHLEKLPPESPARKMFEKELSRISYNLKSGQIADYGPGSSVVYFDGDVEKTVQPNSMLSEAVIIPEQQQTDLNLHNLLTNENGKLSNIPSQLNSETHKGIQNVPINSNNPKVIQNTQLLNVPTNQNSQNDHLQNVPVVRSDPNAQMPNAQMHQMQNVQMPNAQMLNSQMPNVHNPQDWKIINQSAQLSANEIEAHDNQLENQPGLQNQQNSMAKINYNSGGVWQPVEQSHHLSGIVQSVQKDPKAGATY